VRAVVASLTRLLVDIGDTAVQSVDVALWCNHSAPELMIGLHAAAVAIKAGASYISSLSYRSQLIGG
jgi:hypothetical protein